MGDLRPNFVSKKQNEQTVEGENRRGEEEEEEEEKKRSQEKNVWKLTLSMDSSMDHMDFSWNCMDHMDFLYRYMFLGYGL